MFDNKIIFITGGTGTWGQKIVEKLLKDYNVKKIIIFSRSEDKQVIMQNKFNNNKIYFVLGDIRNKEILEKNTIGVDFVIHLAALKHITKCEENSSEAIGINIYGTQNIIDVSIKNNVKKVLYVSTDKAVEPFNIYGNTKAISEKLIINANLENNNKNTIFFVLRAGNILGSNGSVLNKFHHQILKNEPINVTNINMKRFYLKIEDVIDLILFGFNFSKGGEIFIPKSVVLSLKDLIDIFFDVFIIKNKIINEIGIKKGEKMNEILISNNEVENTYNLTEKYFLIDNLNKHNNLQRVNFDNYSTGNQYNKLKINEKKDIFNYVNNLFLNK